MIPVSTLFAGQALDGRAPALVAGLSRDSRQVAAGMAYVAMGGRAEMPGHAAQARTAGASLVVAEAPDAGQDGYLSTSHARWSFARASVLQHGLTGRMPPLVAVSGTAGKSTTTHCAWWAMGGAAAGAARVGTIGWHDGLSERPNPQTTPPPEQLHAFIAGLPQSCPGVAMEISSHAGDQQRTAGLRLAALAFTGLGHDHLDYHRTIASYLSAKLRIVRQLAPGGWCVINADDSHAHTLEHAAIGVGARVVQLGMARGDARLLRQGRDWRLLYEGIDYLLPVRLPGDFNAWNAAAGALLAHATGVPLATAVVRLGSLEAVPGRLELLADAPSTYVDYAHTPDEIAAMLRALRREFPGRRLVCVFGCGGDRDRTKRGPMGCAALEADIAVLTTDNSRRESPRAIAEDVISGLPAGTQVFWAKSEDLGNSNWLDHHALIPSRQRTHNVMVVELDRAKAIQLARALAGTDGITVVAGKGHETSQLIDGQELSWDDRAFVRSCGRLA
jgi:UDP-N-acetylmuramoyl-L-alanyl-D-glutamate--2,6-diaminopimelate ligase